MNILSNSPQPTSIPILNRIRMHKGPHRVKLEKANIWVPESSVESVQRASIQFAGSSKTLEIRLQNLDRSMNLLSSCVKL